MTHKLKDVIKQKSWLPNTWFNREMRKYNKILINKANTNMIGISKTGRLQESIHYLTKSLN